MGRAAYVVDGDTFQLSGVRVRVWGHDTPERDECGYREASAAFRALLGHAVVTCDPLGLDPYGRTVARCRVGGRDIGASMVGAGYSVDFARYSHGAYAAFEADARKAGRGFWRTCWKAE